MSETCKSCMYYARSTHSCDYLIITGKSRVAQGISTKRLARGARVCAAYQYGKARAKSAEEIREEHKEWKEWVFA